VLLTADIMFVSKLPFMISMARKIKFTTSKFLPRRTKPMLIKSLENIFHIYTSRGFNVSTALMDGEFECLRKDITGVQLNTTAADEHVTYIERQIYQITC
jgi:hypothetical protein